MIGEVADNMFTLSNIQEDAAVIFTFDTIEYVKSPWLLGRKALKPDNE